MRSHQPDDELLRSYLLGKLPDPQAERLEEQFLANDELFDLLEGLEAELLARAVRDELAPEERERVLRRLASSPRGRQRLALARSLNAAADERFGAPKPVVLPFRPRQAAVRPAFRWAALAASLVMAAGLSWFTLQQRQEGISKPPTFSQNHPVNGPIGNQPPEETAPVEPQPPAAPTESEQAPQTAMPPLAPRQDGEAKRHPPIRAVFQLALTMTRGDETIEEISVPPATQIVEIQLDLEGFEGFESFQAAVRNRGQEPLWTGSGLKPRSVDWGSVLVLEIPAERLAEGRYEIRVQGTRAGGQPEDLASLEFKLVKPAAG